MGLLTHLFGSKKSIAKELVMDDNKRMALWDAHLSNYLIREKLSKHFNFRNVDKALQDFEGTEKVLGQIEASISPELVNISDEEKTDEEILADLRRLKSRDEIEALSDAVLSVKQKQSALLKLLHEIYNVLKAELHLIRFVRKKTTDSRDLLLRLFEIIFHQEAKLYKVFREQYFFAENKHIHANIVRITRAIILEEEVKEEMETDEEKLLQVNDMDTFTLGEDIFLALAGIAGAPMPTGEDITKGIERMKGFMKNDNIMHKIVKKLRPKYDDFKIRGVILAFRNAYNLGHFEELESEFATYRNCFSIIIHLTFLLSPII